MLKIQKSTVDCILKCIELQQFRTISSMAGPFRATILEKSPIHVHANSGLRLQSSILNQIRGISMSGPTCGKHNFRKFYLGNKRGDRQFKKARRENPEKFPATPIETEVKETGYKYGSAYRTVPEMVPELVVPDLTDCNLKPYVSYRVADIIQQEFTPRELFGYVYQTKIEEDFKNGKLDADGNSLEPSVEEKLDAEKAYLYARRTGSDLFSERIPKLWECIDDYKLEEKGRDTFFYPPLREIKRKDVSEKE